MTGQTPSLSKDRLRLWLKLLKTHGVIEAELRRRFRDQFDTTLPRFDVMSALARYPDGLKMSEVSALLKVSNGNVTGILDRLAESGLAERVAVPGDRRAALARLTPAGRERFDELACAHERWLNETLGGLDSEDIDAFNAVLSSVTRHLDQKMPLIGQAAPNPSQPRPTQPKLVESKHAH